MIFVRFSILCLVTVSAFGGVSGVVSGHSFTAEVTFYPSGTRFEYVVNPGAGHFISSVRLVDEAEDLELFAEVFAATDYAEGYVVSDNVSNRAVTLYIDGVSAGLFQWDGSALVETVHETRSVSYSYTFVNLDPVPRQVGLTDGPGSVIAERAIEPFGAEILTGVATVSDGSFIDPFAFPEGGGDPVGVHSLIVYDPAFVGSGATSFTRDYYVGSPVEEYRDVQIVVGVKNYTESAQTFSVYLGAIELVSGTVAGGDQWEPFGGVFPVRIGEAPYIVGTSLGYMRVLDHTLPLTVAANNTSLCWVVAFTNETSTPPETDPAANAGVTVDGGGFTVRETSPSVGGGVRTETTTGRAITISQSGNGQVIPNLTGGVSNLGGASAVGSGSGSTRTFTSESTATADLAVLQEIADNTGRSADEAETRRKATEALGKMSWDAAISAASDAAEAAGGSIRDVIGHDIPDDLGNGAEMPTLPAVGSASPWVFDFPNPETGLMTGGTFDLNPLTSDIINDIAPWARQLHHLGYLGVLWLAQYLFVSWLFDTVRHALQAVIATPPPTGSSVEAALASNPVTAAGAVPLQLLVTSAFVAVLIAAVSLVVAVYISVSPVGAMQATKALVDEVVGVGTVSEIIAYACLVMPIPGLLAISANYLIAQGLLIFAVPGAQTIVRVFRL